MNWLTRYFDRHLAQTSKGQLWFMFILYLFNGTVMTLTLPKEMLENGAAHDFWFWLGAAATGPIFLLCASLEACLLIRCYRRDSNPLPRSQT